MWRCPEVARPSFQVQLDSLKQSGKPPETNASPEKVTQKAIVPGDSSGAARRDSKQNSKMSQENRRERTPVRSRTRTAIPTIGSGDTKRDLTVSSFMLALVLARVVVAAHTDHPVFWLLIGPTPFAVLHTTRTFLRQRVIRREGPLMFCKRDRLYQETLLTKNTKPIDAA